jgi:hypothetical protein
MPLNGIKAIPPGYSNFRYFMENLFVGFQWFLLEIPGIITDDQLMNDFGISEFKFIPNNVLAVI